MSSKIKVKSSFIESNDGDGVLYSYEFSQEKEVKELTFENQGSPLQLLSVSSSLISGTVTIGPEPFSGTVSIPAPTSVASYDLPLIMMNESDDSSIIIGFTASDGAITTSNDFLIGTVSFSKKPFQEITSRNIDYLYNVNKNDEFTVETYSSPLLETQTSFGLLRTNPKLTGNLKITIDSSEKIWLNSIDANKELSDSRFKKFPISIKSNLAIDAYKFFDNGKTPPEIVYDLHQQAASYFSTQRSFDGQYDRFYTYGAEQLSSRFYEEDFSFFAPLRMLDILPEYFVIFRTNGPINDFTYTEDFSNWKFKINTEILKKADIIKVFDMSENSKIGTYMRNLKNHPVRKTSEMTVSFQSDGYTTFNGISYTEGSFAQKGELLADYFAGSSTILTTEEFLTLGFQRNKILSGSLLNLEFLFDDPDADEYSINRYFGLYMRKNELATFFLSDKALEQHSLEVGQTPLPRRGVDGNKLSSKSFIQNNQNGIKLYANTTYVERSSTVQDVFTTRVNSVTNSGNAIYFTGEWENSTYLSIGDSIRFYPAGSTVMEASASVDFITQEDKRAMIGLTAFTTIGATISGLTNYWVDFSNSTKEESRKLSVFDNEIVQSSRLFYLQDKKGNFYNVNGTKEVITKVDNFTFLTDVEIKLNEKKVDISNFTGINEILSQHPAELLEDIGKSVMEIELIDSFLDNNYIEISSSIASSTEPLRWRIKAQTSLLLPGEFWPDYSIVTDLDGSKYYLTIFNPGNIADLNNLAKTIVGAFKVFPYRVFDIAYKDNKIYFRSKEGGDVTDTIKLVTALSKPTIRIYGYENPLTSSTVNFMGGSDKKKNRVKISRDIADGILSSEYFQTTGNYSKLKDFDVFGNKIRYFSYLENPKYDNTEEIEYFNGAEDYAIIELEKDSKFQLTHDDKVTSYSIHKSKFGIFSFFPLRDYDTDYIVSDYGKNYDAELAEYFDNIGAKVFSIYLDPASTNPFDPFYKVNFFESVGLSGEYTFLGVYEDGRAPLDFNGVAQLTFTGTTASLADLRFYRGTAGNQDISSISLTGTNTPSKLVILPGEKILYFEENQLSKFKGFFSLSPVISSEDMRMFSHLESQWSFSRFFLTKISSEYQRLQETYQKDIALTSKVVPYVSKWVSPNGKDIRDNFYRLNYSRAFGTMNFTPSNEFPDADSKNHTHEWPYLANVPKNVNPIKYADFSFSYLFEKPDLDKYDFYSIKRDWFSEYFVTGYPSELYKVDGIDTIVPIEAAEKYSVFKYDTLSQKTYTIFRGIRVEIGEKLSSDGAVLLGSTKYDGYKFSSVIVPTAEDDTTRDDNVLVDIIVNEKFKFILNLIKVKISTYRNPEGNLSYVDLYTAENKRNKGSYLIDATKISPLNYDYRYEKGVPVDIEFPTALSPIGSSAVLRGVSTKYNLSNYIYPLLKTGAYSFIYSIYRRNAAQEFSYNFAELKYVIADKIKLESIWFNKYVPVLGILSHVSLPSIERIPNHRFFYAGGGDSYYNRVRENLSFYEISKILQNVSSKITPAIKTISIDGTIISNKALFRIVTPEKYYTQIEHFAIPDEDKPSELYNYSVIGAVLKTQQNPQYLYRYQGDFVPKFRDVFYFGSREQENFSLEYNNDFKLADTFLAEDLSNTFILRNQYYSKVADEEILRINQSSGYKSLYPLVNEISIDRKDLFIWNSTWDDSYYRKYSTVSNFIDTKGTVEMKETKSFLGSKMMKIKKEFSLYEFIVSGETPEIVTVEDGLLVTINIDVYSKFLRNLMGTTAGDRARKEFYNIALQNIGAISSTEVDSLAESYLRKNIINLFEIAKVNFYLLETGNTGTLPGEPERPLIEYNENGGILSTLTEKQLISKKYILRKDVKTTILPNLMLQVQFPIDSRFYTSLGFGIDVKRI
jgi:hypothetical protein